MHRTNFRSAVTGALALGVIGSSALLAPAAFASHGSSHGGGGVSSTGKCSVVGSWTLKAKRDDGMLEVEAEVDVIKEGQHWSWQLLDDGVKVAAGSSVTAPPSDSFTIERKIADRPGKDAITFHATTKPTGNTCDGSLSI